MRGSNLRIRWHNGFGHGLRPGETRDINCLSCKRERRLLAYVVTDVRGAQTVFQAYNPTHARKIAEGDGYQVQEVFRE